MKTSENALDDAFSLMRKDKEMAKFFCRESFKLEMSESILELMKKHHLSRPKFAKKLNIDKKELDNILIWNKTISLNKLSDIFFALGYRIQITTKKWDERGKY
jgi:hypothetical protein